MCNFGHNMAIFPLCAVFNLKSLFQGSCFFFFWDHFGSIFFSGISLGRIFFFWNHFWSLLTCLPEVGEAGVVDGEEADRGAVLGTHVGDGGAVRDRQARHTRTEELHEFTHHADPPQVLRNAKQQCVNQSGQCFQHNCVCQHQNIQRGHSCASKISKWRRGVLKSVYDNNHANNIIYGRVTLIHESLRFQPCGLKSVNAAKLFAVTHCCTKSCSKTSLSAVTCQNSKVPHKLRAWYSYSPL